MHWYIHGDISRGVILDPDLLGNFSDETGWVVDVAMPAISCRLLGGHLVDSEWMSRSAELMKASGRVVEPIYRFARAITMTPLQLHLAHCVPRVFRSLIQTIVAAPDCKWILRSKRSGIRGSPKGVALYANPSSANKERAKQDKYAAIVKSLEGPSPGKAYRKAKQQLYKYQGEVVTVSEFLLRHQMFK